jgi:four helix bundle protein
MRVKNFIYILKLLTPKKMREEIKFRTKNIGVQVIALIDGLPQKQASWVLAKQILRSSTAIGANYRAACRAKSTPDFISKLKSVEEEADETMYWLEVMQEAGLINKEQSTPLLQETSELLAIVVSSIKTVRARLPKTEKS